MGPRWVVVVVVVVSTVLQPGGGVLAGVVQVVAGLPHVLLQEALT